MATSSIQLKIRVKKRMVYPLVYAMGICAAWVLAPFFSDVDSLARRIASLVVRFGMTVEAS